MKILNLYAGIGGNRRLWEGHEVIAVENVEDVAELYQKLYPTDTVIVADAHQYLIDHYAEFDFIWSSPPCPTHSRARYGLGFHGGKVKGVYPDMRLYQEILFLKHHFTGQWVVENVQAYYQPLIEPTPIGRHWYWSNFPIYKVAVESMSLVGGITTSSGKRLIRKTVEELERALGYKLQDYKIRNKRLLLRNAVEPEIGLHILNQATGFGKSNEVYANASLFGELAP